jgi:hypothetical protein
MSIDLPAIDDSDDVFRTDYSLGHRSGDSDLDFSAGSGSDSDEEPMRAEDSEGEDPDQDADIFDWETFRAPTDGFPAWDKLGAEYEAEAALGTYCHLRLN